MNSPLDESSSERNRRPWLTLVALAFCLEGIFLALFVAPVSHSIDFYHVHFVPQAVRSGLNVYDRADHPAIQTEIDHAMNIDPSVRLARCVGANRQLYATGFCPTATPLLYAVHSLGLVGSFVFRFWTFHIVATALGMVGLFLTARAVGFNRPVSWLLCGLVTSFCWGLLLDAELANVTRFQLFGLGLASIASVSRRTWGMFAAGFILAVGAAYKPTILPSIVFWLAVLAADRRWSESITGLAGLTMGALSAFVFPLVLFDSLDCWWEWRTFAGSELTALAVSFPGNYSLQSALAASGSSWFTVLPWVIGGSIIVAFWWTALPASDESDSPSWRDQRLCLAISLGPLWTILASPLTWVQYAALAMPLAIVLLRIAVRFHRSNRAWLVAIAIATGLAGGLAQRFITVDAHWVDCLLLWIGWIGLALLAIAMVALTSARPIDRGGKPIGLSKLRLGHAGFGAGKPLSRVEQ